MMVEVKIRIKGQIGEQWSEWFDGMTIIPKETNETELTGSVEDQAALFGLLTKIRDLGLALISVEVTDVEPAEM